MSGLRRRAMMRLMQSEPAPLYRFDDRNTSVGTNIRVVVDAGRISFATAANSRTGYLGRATQATYVTNTVKADAIPADLHAGDVIELRVLGIAYTGSANAANYATINFRAQDGTAIGIGKRIDFGSGDGVLPDVVFTATLETDAAGILLYYTCYRAATLTFVPELYVNGVRYI